MPDPGKAVFLSYAREDSDAARRIADALRVFGVEVWFDMNELRGGDAWDVKIRKQIRDCALFIPIISENTQERGEGYFRREWKLAVERTYDLSDNRAYIVPVITDATAESEADVPEQFLKAQFTRLVGGVPTAGFIENVKRLLQGPAPRSSGVRATAPEIPKASPVGGSGPDPKSIAVLPFVNRSSDADQEYFVDGLSEELLNNLAKVHGLKVTSRSSAFSYKGSTTRIGQIAKELNVANILEGSVRKSGNRLRISVQLIDAQKDEHLWSESYDRTMDDIFEVQDEISVAVVEQMKVTLLGPATPRKKSYDPEAYALFLQGRELGRHDTRDGYRQALSLFEQALQIDPGLAPAWVQMATVYFNQVSNGERSIAEGARLVTDAIDRATAIEPNLAGAHSVLGMKSQFYDQDTAAAARHFERAISLEPANTEILSQATYLARGLGKLELAVRIAEFINKQDPVNSMGHARLCGCYMRVGRYDEAIASGRAALRLTPGRSQTHYAICLSLLYKGDPAAALSEVQLEPAESWRLEGLAMAHHALGDREKSDAALNELIRKWTGDAAWNIACVHAFRGETDRAFEWLENAVVSRDSGAADTAWTKQFESIHDDPRWMPFLRRIGKAPEQLAAIKFEVNLPS